MTTHSFFSCKKRTLAFFLMICMIIPFASCDEKNYVEEVSQNSIIVQESIVVSDNSMAESTIKMDDYINIEDIENISNDLINPKGKYDFVKVPFRNKDGIIDFSDKFPFKNIVEDESLRQELESKLIEIGKILDNLYNVELNVVSNKKVEIIDITNYYCEVLPEIAKNKEELVAYYKKYFSGTYFEPYTSIDEWAEKELFAGERPKYKIINNSLCFLVYEDILGEGNYNMKPYLITLKSDTDVDVIHLYMPCSIAEYGISKSHLVKSNEYGWVLENNTFANYDPTKWYFEYSFIKNAPKINLILSGSDAVKIDGKKVFVNNNGAEYELIENFLSVKEMTDYFNEIFSPDIAKKYIGEYISVYYEKDGKLFRKVGAEKAKMAEFNLDIYYGQIDKEFYGQCNYVLDGKTYENEQIKMFCTLSDQDNGYMFKLSDLKTAQELPLEKIG